MASRVEEGEQEFDGQREGEQLLFVFRRHIIAMRKRFLWSSHSIRNSLNPTPYLAAKS